MSVESPVGVVVGRVEQSITLFSPGRCLAVFIYRIPEISEQQGRQGIFMGGGRERSVNEGI